MFSKIIEKDRLFNVLYSNVLFDNPSLKETLINYTNKYISYHSLTDEQVRTNYLNFIKQYNKDIKYYLGNGNYPALQKNYHQKISREEYDVFLLLSTLLTQHRYDIASSITKEINDIFDSALVIGSGVGIEVELIKNKYNKTTAYDIDIDNFCSYAHPDVDFHACEFKGSHQYYNDIFIIELLEHITDPYALLKDAKKSLDHNGRIIATLATNIPQFDHLYNFDSLSEFHEKIEELGLKVVKQKEIVHKYMLNGLKDSSNTFIILKHSS